MERFVQFKVPDQLGVLCAGRSLGKKEIAFRPPDHSDHPDPPTTPRSSFWLETRMFSFLLAPWPLLMSKCSKPLSLRLPYFRICLKAKTEVTFFRHQGVGDGVCIFSFCIFPGSYFQSTVFWMWVLTERQLKDGQVTAALTSSDVCMYDHQPQEAIMWSILFSGCWLTCSVHFCTFNKT